MVKQLSPSVNIQGYHRLKLIRERNFYPIVFVLCTMMKLVESELAPLPLIGGVLGPPMVGCIDTPKITIV